MVNLAIEETSGVDYPAHLHEGWLVMKSADSSEVQRVLDETLTEEEVMSDTQTEVTPTATDEQVEATESTETTETVEEVEKAEMTLEEALKKIADLQAKLVELESKESDSEMEKSETVENDFLKSAPESVVKMFQDMRKQAEEATAELQKERDAKADAEAISKAKGWANLNLDAEKVGPTLRQLANTNPELAKSVEEVLASVNAQAESAQIFAEIGKSADFKSDNALERLTTMAKSAVEEGVAKSFEQAFVDVATKNPDLYSQYLTEKGA
jgi:hypothetical protein